MLKEASDIFSTRWRFKTLVSTRACPFLKRARFRPSKHNGASVAELGQTQLRSARYEKVTTQRTRIDINYSSPSCARYCMYLRPAMEAIYFECQSYTFAKQTAWTWRLDFPAATAVAFLKIALLRLGISSERTDMSSCSSTATAERHCNRDVCQKSSPEFEVDNGRSYVHSGWRLGKQVFYSQ